MEKKGVVEQYASGRYDYSKSFAEQVQDYLDKQIPVGDTLLVGPSPEVFLKIGLPNLPVTINTKHLDYALKGTKDYDHYIGEALVNQLPEAIKTPIAIMISKTKPSSSIVVMLEIRHNGKQIVAPVVVEGVGKLNGIRFDSNAISSIYGKKYSIKKVLRDAIDNESNGKFSLFYLNKSKATALLQGAKVPMPKMPAIRNDGFVHSITDINSPVKMNFVDVTESQQFKRWFGDWQKHPNKASKVVNADGTPKVVYHGSYSGFTVFDKSNIHQHSTAPVNAHFFTDDMDVAYSYTGYKKEVDLSKADSGDWYPGGIYPSYLSIKNPYVVDFQGKLWSDKEIYGMDINEIATYAYENGYDGVIAKNIIDEGGQGDKNWNEENSKKPATDYIVFERTQIKSATDNIGTFDGDNPDIRYSDRTADNSSIKEQLKAAAPILAELATVAEVKESRTFTSKQDVKDWILNEYSKFDFKVSRKDFGEVIVDKKRVSKGLSYLSTLDEYYAFLAVPNVIKTGTIIENRPVHKNRAYGTITFAAPVLINGKRMNLAVVVRQEGKNYYKVHRLTVSEGSALLNDNQKTLLKRRAELTITQACRQQTMSLIIVYHLPEKIQLLFHNFPTAPPIPQRRSSERRRDWKKRTVC